MSERLNALFEKAKRLPLEPGVYYMKNADGKIIYVGKAKMLRNRVSQYFTNVERHLPKTYKMVSNVHTFDYIVTASELEAFILECSEIKHYSPEYNILLKDGKTYPYIKVNTATEYPTVTVTRRRLNDGAKYFGPFTGNVKEIVATVNKTFKLVQCKHKFPYDIGKGRPCLNYQMKNCCGVCTGKVSREEYAQIISGAIQFLNGNYGAAIKELTAQMNEASEQMRYEKAAELRDRIFAIKKLSDTQQVVDSPSINRDVIGCSIANSKCVIVILAVRKGKIVYKHTFELEADGFENKAEGMADFITQHYFSSTDIPKEIVVPFDVSEAATVAEMLTELSGRKTVIKKASRGNGAKVLAMANNNAQKITEVNESRRTRQNKAVGELSTLLSFEKPCEYIEAIDISNTAGAENVGAIIRFKNGAPDKSGYKLFKIKGFDGQDDYGSIKEVLSRRFNAYEEGRAGFDRLPDLLLIDGGIGQVHAAKEIVDAFGYNLPVFGMVKDESHKTRGLTDGERELDIKMTSMSFTLVARIQEEVHRFVIKFHRESRSKKTVTSKLDGISGIGEVKKKALLKRFKTVAEIENATVEQLCTAEGIGKALAEEIYSYFHG